MKAAEEKTQEKIVTFFDNMSVGRNKKISGDVILNYEQNKRGKAILDAIRAKKKDKILEVGCGNGRDLIELGRTGAEIIGIDISDKMMDGAKELLKQNNIENVKIEYGDVTDLTYPDNTFSKVLASEVLEHIPEYEKAISEMARVCKPGGEVTISTPNKFSMHGFEKFFWYETLGKKDNHPYDKWKTYKILKEALERNGLRVLEHKSVCFIPGFVVVNNLPEFVKKMVVKVVEKTEPSLQKIFDKNGYIIILKAVKTIDGQDIYLETAV